MKNKQNIPLRLLVLSALLLAVSPQINPLAYAAEFKLSSECTSNKLTLIWYGAPAIELQQATNLANPVWLDVPGSKGMSFREIPMTNPLAFFRLVDKDPPGDIDHDFLDDWFETNGWTIFIDTHGYGTDGLVERNVTSDPSLGDTDGDGVEDFWEWLLGTDPRATDTDGDGLSDADEWFKWNTSPTSVDTDGDARGPNYNLPPKAQLFDGNELSLLHTSPTLDDTDGDGRTDYEEYDHLGRNPLIAEVPKLGVELVDAVDMRLDVEYAEEVGVEHQYGGELTISDSTRYQYSTEASMNWSVMVGAEATVGMEPSATVKSEVTVGGELSVGFEAETTHSVERSQSDYLTDSRTRTETAASGSMSGGIRLVNNGPVTYTITDLGMTVRYVQPGTGAGGKPSLQTLATLIPTLGAYGITLAPGDSTPVLQVAATGLNASRVKQFMARPNSLYLEPAFYELENAEGFNFDYLEEITRWRTARVQIDYGNGTNEEYRVATNVERNEDGTYAGVTMGNVVSNILHIPFQTVPRRNLQTNSLTNERVLSRVRSVNTISTTNGFWAVVWSGEGTPQTNADFENIALHAGEQVMLVFVRDEDGDGLFSAEEQHYRTDAVGSGDSDSDGLSDVFEVRTTNWTVSVAGKPSYPVSSDPAQADQDGDGLTDSQEYNGGVNSTDPMKSDTDDDGIPDNVDLWRLVPAKLLCVKGDATGLNNGSSWANAFTNLQNALMVASNGLATSGVSTDDVAEIWVAAGVYKPTTSTNNRAARFELVNNTAIYGGFTGGETKLSQRNPDPLINGTVLSGDLMDNDPTVISDNSTNVCFANTNVGTGTILDGFMITGGNSSQGGGGIYSRGYPQLRNLLFWANRGNQGGGLYQTAIVASELRISDCLFVQNDAVTGGGIHFGGSPASSGMSLTNCQFVNNRSSEGGGIFAAGAGNGLKLFIKGCTFNLNSATNYGGAINLGNSTASKISRTQFEENTADRGGAIGTPEGSPTNIVIEVGQSVFYKNRATGYGGAIRIGGPSATIFLYVLNSTFCTNYIGTSASGDGSAIDGTLNGFATISIENSIVWGNLRLGSTAGSRSRVRTSCLWESSIYPGAGNFNADPKFVDSTGGNLRLQSSSPCIDQGNNYIDYEPKNPGLQLLPATDMDGNWRIVDGNSDGTATVDMGAYERQGP